MVIQNQMQMEFLEVGERLSDVIELKARHAKQQMG